MNIDSRICEYVIADFVRTDTPILTVHDSFIAPFEEEDRLLQLMKEAFKKVTKKKGVKAKFNDNLTKKQFFAHGAQDRNWFLDMVSFINKGSPSQRYLKRLEKHRQHYSAR